jgi:hypothetical protein
MPWIGIPSTQKIDSVRSSEGHQVASHFHCQAFVHSIMPFTFFTPLRQQARIILIVCATETMAKLVVPMIKIIVRR